MTQRAFLARIQQAVTTAKAKGAALNRLAVIAQATHESGWGASLLTVAANNLFGIKARPDDIRAGNALPMRTREWDGAKYVSEIAYWRMWPSWNECLVSYSEIVESLPWFRGTAAHADPPHGDGDAAKWLAALEVSGQPDWATDPKYVVEVTAAGYAVAAMLQMQWPTSHD